MTTDTCNQSADTTLEDIYRFLESETGIRYIELTPDIALVEDLHIDGDDFAEMIQAFANKFDVNMESYRWYFHHVEEGLSIGAIFFKPPNGQVEHIPVTPHDLLIAAKSGAWSIDYPYHEVNSERHDLLFDRIIGSIFLAFVLTLLLLIVA